MTPFTAATEDVHMNLNTTPFCAMFCHADGSSERHPRLYPKRAARKRNHAEHARNSKPFWFRQPNLGHAIPGRARAERVHRSPRPQSTGVDYSGAESAH